MNDDLKILVVHQKAGLAHRANGHESDPDVFHTGVEGPLVGRGFHVIIVQPDVHLPDSQWLTEYLPTKLYPGGRIIWL